MSYSFMKKTLWFVVVCLSVSCSSGPVVVKKAPEFVGPYYTGGGGAGTTLAVLLPEGKAAGNQPLPESEQWVLSYVQGTLTADFSRYSAMDIVDRQNMDRILEEQDLSLSRSGGDKNTLIKIGEITNAQFLLTGVLEKMNQTDYGLQLSVVNAETAVLRASHYATVSMAELRSMQPLREASIDLLKQMGVELTGAGEAAIRSVALSEAEGAVALARGIAAGSDNAMEKLIYLTNAVAFDSSQLEAIELLASAGDGMGMMGTGAALQNDAEQRKQFQTMMEQFEEHYQKHPPFELVFIPKTTQEGATDYLNHEATVKFQVTLRESVEFDTMNTVLKIILQNLKKTGNQVKWGFKEWPGNAKIFNQKRNFAVAAELLDDKGEVIDTVEFNMLAQLVPSGGKVFADSSQNLDIVFSKMNIDRLTTEPQVRITQIGGMTSRESLEEDFIRISSALELPPKRLRNPFALAGRRNSPKVAN